MIAFALASKLRIVSLNRWALVFKKDIFSCISLRIFSSDRSHQEAGKLYLPQYVQLGLLHLSKTVSMRLILSPEIVVFSSLAAVLYQYAVTGSPIGNPVILLIWYCAEAWHISRSLKMFDPAPPISWIVAGSTEFHWLCDGQYDIMHTS